MALAAHMLSLSMRRGAMTRWLAVVLATSFGFVTIQPGFVAPCPHHEPALALLARGMAMPPAAMHDMDAMDLSHAPDRPSSPHHGHGHDHGGDGCTCHGASCSTHVSVAGVQAVEWFTPDVAIATGIRAVAAATMPRTAPPPHTLPFHTPPPQSPQALIA